MPVRFRIHTIAEAIVLGTTAIVPLFIWQAASAPFETPRLVVLGVAAALVTALAVVSHRTPPALPAVLVRSAAAWLLAIGLSAAFAPYVSSYALIVWTLPIAWAVLVVWVRPSPRSLANALVAASTVVAGCAVAQWIGWDPLSAFGWRPVGAYGPRMRVYATLGNPNFAGAYLAGMLPLSIAWRADGARFPAARAAVPMLHAAALVTTGSRAAWLGAVVGLTASGLARDDERRRWVPNAALLAIITVGVLLAPTRAIEETLRGRVYIWTTTAAHALEHPFAGNGPGSFAIRYPAWETERIAHGVDESVRQYAAAQRHAHNDYVEVLVDFGIPGLLSFWAVITAAIAWSLRRVAELRQDLRDAAAAGIAALAAIALVDFPFQRPVESVTWWTLLALVVLTGTTSEHPRA